MTQVTGHLLVRRTRSAWRPERPVLRKYRIRDEPTPLRDLRRAAARSWGDRAGSNRSSNQSPAAPPKKSQMTRRSRRPGTPRCRSSTCARRSRDVPAFVGSSGRGARLPRLGPGLGASAAVEARAWPLVKGFRSSNQTIQIGSLCTAARSRAGRARWRRGSERARPEDLQGDVREGRSRSLNSPSVFPLAVGKVRGPRHGEQ